MRNRERLKMHVAPTSEHTCSNQRREIERLEVTEL